MPPRFDAETRTLSLSVRDLVASGLPSGHLVLDAPQSSTARALAGQRAHQAVQADRQGADPAYEAEAAIVHTFVHGRWTVVLQGRVDGMLDLGGHVLVEEIKATALDERSLRATHAEHWPAWTAQLEAYLWMLARAKGVRPLGRLVLVSLLDGARHDLPVPFDGPRLDRWVQRRVGRMIRLHDRAQRHDAARRTTALRWPFRVRRPGQEGIGEAVREALSEGKRILVQAPTGLGKTAAVLEGALRHAASTGRRVFWATSRNTQQAQVLDTLHRFARPGVPLTRVGLRSREHVCLNEAVTCRPDLCAHADRYVDKVDEARLVEAALDAGGLDANTAMAWGREHTVCPFQLLVDVAEHADAVVGDVNFAFRPRGGLRRLFADDAASERIVVVDEAHQLPDRAREHRSPVLRAADARAVMRESDPSFAPFVAIARDLLGIVDEAVAGHDPDTRRGDDAVTRLDADAVHALAKRVDGVSLDHALLRTRRPADGHDPWPDLARAVLAASDALRDDTVPLVPIAHLGPRGRAVHLVCLDAAPFLGPQIAALAGFVGLSATLSPPDRTRGLLGLPDDAVFVDVPSPFDPARRPVLVSATLSTRYRDRAATAPALATLLTRALDAVPGHAAVFVSSFAVLDDLAPRLTLAGRDVVLQRPGMDDAAREAVMDRLAKRRPAVLLGVLGGIFAEGIDPPPGALRAVFIVGPGLPPVGLERDLLRTHYESRFGDGWLHASLVPGMIRVVQAAGRLVRRPEDHGAIVLIGRRFRWRDHRALFPRDWTPTLVDDPAKALAAVFRGGFGEDPGQAEDPAADPALGGAVQDGLGGPR